MIDKNILKKIRHIEIHSRKLVNEVFSGEYHSVFKGAGINFSEVREYHHGDDTRFIDWNVTARAGKPFIKIFEEERQLNVVLMIDASASNFFSTAEKNKLEIAAEISAIIAFSALQNNDKVGVILFTDTIEKYLPPKRGRKYSLRIIRELLTFKPERPQTDISKALEFAVKTFKRKSVIFLISDFFDQNYEKKLAILAKKHDLTNIIITDIREFIFEKCGLINFQDAETGEITCVDTADANTRNFFKKENCARIEKTVKTFAKYDIDTINLSSDKSYIEPLVAYFKKRIKNINRIS